MIRRITITDLTRMQGGFVCVAGYDEAGEAVRLSRPRVLESDLAQEGQAVVFPTAVVECDVREHQPDPPHTEDYTYGTGSIRLVERLAGPRWSAVLMQALFPTAAALFEQPICHDPGSYVQDGQGPRSLGTLVPRAIKEVSYGQDVSGNWDYRLIFMDEQRWYRLKITDFTWHRYCGVLRGSGKEPSAIATALTAMLKKRQVFLRLGLSRGWKKFPDRCFLQINGIYTFPDYLDGKTWFDLKS